MTPKMQIMKAAAPNNQEVYYMGWTKTGTNYHRRYTNLAALLVDLAALDTDMQYWELDGLPIEQVPGYLRPGYISIQAGDKVTAALEFHRTVPFDITTGIVVNAVIVHATANRLYTLDPDAGLNIFVNAFFNQ